MADIGQAINTELAFDKQDTLKQPRRKFIGRKTAAERAGRKAVDNGSIEGGSGLQGAFEYVTHRSFIDILQWLNQGKPLVL